MLKKFALASIVLLAAALPAFAKHHHHHHHKKSLDATNPGNGHSVNGPASNGAGTGENKPSATGGQAGGSTNQQ